MAKRASVWGKWVAGLVLLALLAGAAAWLARKPIASAFAQRWCTASQLACTLEIDRLDLTRIEISNLTVADLTEAAPELLAAKTIAVELDWQGIFKPVATSIMLDQPVIAAAYDGRNITLGGLEKRFAKGAGSAAIPALDIRNGRLVLTTPAGDITGSFDANGTWPSHGQARFMLAPAELSSAAGRLSLHEGALNLTAQAGKLNGTLKLTLASLMLDGIQASDVRITARIEDTSQPQLDWQASLESLNRQGGLSLSQASASGAITLSQMPETAGADIFALLETITLTGQAAQAAWQDHRGEALTLELSANQTAPGRLGLTLETEISNPAGPSFTGEKITLSFAGTARDRLATLSGTGNLVLGNMAMVPDRRAALLEALSARLPFEAHANALTRALDRGLTDFTIGGQYRLDMNTLQDWQLILPRTIAVQSRSGLSAVLAPGAGQSAAVIEPGGAEISGVLTIKGGGLPQINTDIHTLHVSGPNISLKTGGLTLQPWQAGQTVIGADLNQFGFESTASSLNLNALGELSLSGTLLGISLEHTRLFGGIDAARGAEGWRVQTANQACLGLNLGRARTSNNLVLHPAALSICPQGGRFVHQENGHATGQFTLGNIRLPFTGTDISGSAALDNTVIDWSAGRTLVMKISAEQLELPMLIAGRSLNLNTPAPYVEIDLGDHTHITARLDQSALSGDLIPANVAIGEARFNGRLEPGAFNGTARTTQVAISDINADPIYRPLLAEFDLLFEGSKLTMFGPVRLAGSGRSGSGLAGPASATLANVRLNLDLLQLNGTGQIKTRQLDFTPQGLQPKDLSDRFRGFLSNGRGAITGLADFTIRSGTLAGTGEINAVNFGFDTFRVGAIDGINGRIHFSDILTMTTAPSQRVTIARINPGIPLADGEIEFQILGGKQANIERASWPFAGGRLEIDPVLWSIAGTSDILKVNAREIELAQLIDILSLPDVKAEGTISGTFPIELRGGNAFIRGARLAADNQGGKLSYTGDAARQAGSADDRVQAAFTALRDFRFTVLEIGVDGNLVDDIIVSARLLGSNPDVYGGAEFDFNISVDSKLAQLIQSGRRAATTNWITDAIINDQLPQAQEPFN